MSPILDTELLTQFELQDTMRPLRLGIIAINANIVGFPDKPLISLLRQEKNARFCSNYVYRIFIVKYLKSFY
jgi:hypothetical protein